MAKNSRRNRANARSVRNNSSDSVSRRRLQSAAGVHMDGQRDLYEVMGYPRTLTVESYADVYSRQDIAGRIVDAFPDATWREVPDFKATQAFVDKWKALDKRVKLWRAFHRLDRLMNIGHYGVMVLGLDGGEPMSEPADGSDYDLLYVQPHGERTAEITQWESDPNSPRFGQPKMYRIRTGTNWTGVGGGERVINVHHSRTIHVAERALEDISIGIPRLERIYNRLMDLDKLLGGSAEMYWQNVAMIMAFIAQADSEIEPTDREEMKEQLEEMQNRLRRFLTLQGVDAKNLAPSMQGASPGEHIEKQIDVIAGASGIPKRILIGNEAGELASSQDETAWAARIAERREQFATPTILEAFIGKGQRLGFLPDGFDDAEWPEADTLGETGRAEVALKKSQAVQAFSSAAGATLLVSEDEFRGWLGEGPMEIANDEEDLDEEELAAELAAVEVRDDDA